jgi:hypothetical protein
MAGKEYEVIVSGYSMGGTRAAELISASLADCVDRDSHCGPLRFSISLPKFLASNQTYM